MLSTPARPRSTVKDSANPRIVATIILAMALVAVLGYRSLPKADVALPFVEDCRLDRQACASDLPEGGRIGIAIEPRPIPAARPFNLRIDLAGIRPDRVEVDFTGVGMNMGVTRLRLQAAGSGRYAGQVTLPVCVTGSMVWQATVRLGLGRRVISIPFRFESRHG